MWNGSVKLIKSEASEKNENGFSKEKYVYSEEICAEINDTTRWDTTRIFLWEY